MKQSLKNETDMLESINKIQALLIVLDKKVDALMRRSASEASPSPKPQVNNTNDDRNRARVMHKAICADCKKECSLPFKPSGERPVYCQDCFSRRKVISMSGMKVDDKPKEPPSAQIPIDIQKPQAKTKRKITVVRKPVAKKKPTSKKK